MKSISRCLKITEKGSFMIASEASNVYIFGEQNLTRNAKNCQTVLPERSVVIGQKLVQMPFFKNSNAIFLAIFIQRAIFSTFDYHWFGVRFYTIGYYWYFSWWFFDNGR